MQIHDAGLNKQLKSYNDIYQYAVYMADKANTGKRPGSKEGITYLEACFKAAHACSRVH